MAVKWQLAGSKYGMSEGKNEVYPYKKARLSDSENDLSKEWVVVYYVWSETKKQLVRKRVVVKGSTIEERKKYAAAVIKEVNGFLKSGRAVVDEIKAPEPKPVVKKKDIPTILTLISFFLEIKGNTLKKNSSKTYKSALNKFKAYLKAKDLLKLRLHEFTPAQAFAYIDSLTGALANKSVNNHLGAVESLFNFYIDRQELKTNPFVAVKTLPERPGKHTPFRPDQIAKIKEACELAQEQQLWLFLNFMYFTLARPNSELRLLKVRDILEKTIRIDGENAKAGGTGHVMIAPGLEQLLVKYRIREYNPNFYVFGSGGLPGEKVVHEKFFYNQHRKILTLLKMTDQPHDLYG